MKDYLLISLGIVIGVAIAAMPIYMMGRKDGASLEVKKSLEKAIEAEDSRRKIDAKVNALSNPDMCHIIGLSDDAIKECLLRLEEPKSKLR